MEAMSLSFGGAAVAFDAVCRKWLLLWIATGVLLAATIMTVYANYQRIRVARVMRERLERGGSLATQSGEIIERLLVDNVRVHAIVAGLIGIRMRVSVEVKEEEVKRQ